MTAAAGRPVANYFSRYAAESLRSFNRGANKNLWEMGGATGTEWAGQMTGQAVSATMDEKLKKPAVQYMQRTTIPGMYSWFTGNG